MRSATARCSMLGLMVSITVAQVPAEAGQASTAPLDLRGAVELALDRYPTLLETEARARAAGHGVEVSRTVYLPRLDAIWQGNRATRNNIWGLLLPQGTIPNISGPVATATTDSVWSSAAGLLLSWEALDFGKRRAGVDVARAQRSEADAHLQLTRLDVAAAAADAFLAVVAADATVTAAEANVRRLEVFAQSVRTYVDSQLRPGADASRATAALAEGRTELIRAREVATLARLALSDAIGSAGDMPVVATDGLGELPPTATLQQPSLPTHPAALAAAARTDVARARDRQLASAYAPQIHVQAAVSSRQTSTAGVSIAESNASNWVAGVSVTFPLLDVFTLRPARRVEGALIEAEQADYERTVQALRTEEQQARARLDAARQIAENTPIQRSAATDAERQARARYDNGLASLTDVADAQRLLAQAEAADALARMAVWRALLGLYGVRGDLSPFLDQIPRR